MPDEYLAEVVSVAKIRDFPCPEWAGETKENYFIITYSNDYGLFLGMSENGTTGARLNLTKVSPPVEGLNPSFKILAGFLRLKLPEGFNELDN